MTVDSASALIRAAGLGDLQLRPIVLRVVGERTNPDDMDDRVYLFAQVSGSAADRIKGFAEPVGDKPLVWPFDGQSNGAKIDQAVNEAIASAEIPTLLVRSITFRSVVGIWRFVGGASSPLYRPDRSV
jgi:hypothetical protein